MNFCKDKKIWFASMLLLCSLFITGCHEKHGQVTQVANLEEPPGEACSIKLQAAYFTRSLNNAAGSAVVEKDIIIIKSDPKTDYFNDPDGKLSNNAPILLAKVDNTKPFTLTAKVTPAFQATYDAGTFYIYSSDRLWQKFAFERDERGRTRIVSVRTIETSDDNNHDVITQESVFLKVSSDTKTVGFYFSTDNENWNLARLYKNIYPAILWLGISSQSPVGNGNSTAFESCTLTDTAIEDFRLGI
ncbi:MAG: DUF1349 domain-containing protein [Cyclobacteriaceae bacterium]|nr:DUF1349 domain-containing protein [Cyclobacteriaceae bacterium]